MTENLEEIVGAKAAALLDLAAGDDGRDRTVPDFVAIPASATVAHLRRIGALARSQPPYARTDQPPTNVLAACRMMARELTEATGRATILPDPGLADTCLSDTGSGLILRTSLHWPGGASERMPGIDSTALVDKAAPDGLAQGLARCIAGLWKPYTALAFRFAGVPLRRDRAGAGLVMMTRVDVVTDGTIHVGPRGIMADLATADRRCCFSGPVTACTEPVFTAALAGLPALIASLHRRLGGPALELEIVTDPQGRRHLVQATALARAMLPGVDMPAMTASGPLMDLRGLPRDEDGWRCLTSRFAAADDAVVLIDLQADDHLDAGALFACRALGLPTAKPAAIVLRTISGRGHMGPGAHLRRALSLAFPTSMITRQQGSSPLRDGDITTIESTGLEGVFAHPKPKSTGDGHQIQGGLSARSG
ncbi:MAG: hypothetical protein CMO30_20505 [Tistrella sp.]|nr:hypothetical protein [Tistrella sp.]MAD39913.1 hypothetical protein [Tistrella sp.]MBA77658.1 hypothetical protein [Tistrella sp.]